MTQQPSNPCRTRAGRRTRRAFTLVEMTVALAIASMLFLGMGGAIMIVTKVLPSTSDPLSKALETCSVADTIAEELRLASSIEERTATRLRFTTPDRNGDGLAESIIYEWSGVSGAPLYRTFNGGTPVAVTTDVRSFSFTYILKTVSTTSPVTTTSTSPEMLLSYFNGWPTVPSPTIGTQTTDPSAWGAEFFTIDQATLPVNINTLRVTRVQVMMKKLGTTGNVSLGIYRSIGGGNPQPATTPQGTPATLAVSSLPTTSGWVTFTMPSDVSVSMAGNNKEFVLVVKGTVASAASMQSFFSTSAPKDTSPTATWTSNAGGSWSPNKASEYKTDFPFYAYGTYTTQSTSNVTTTTYYLQSVGITLQAGAAASGRAATTVEVLGYPQVAGP